MSEANDTIRWVYDHLSATLDRDERAHELYIQKSRHLVALSVALFAVLSFGLSKSDWAKDSAHQVVIIVVAVAAGLCLLRAFLAGLACLAIVDTRVVGVKTLKAKLESGEIRDVDPDEVVGNLATNLASTILDNRELGRSRKGHAHTLNRYTVIGALLTAVFISYSLGGHALIAQQPPRAETNTMSQTPENSNQPSESPSPSAPLVEPSDTVQTGEPLPPPASLVEPSDIIQKSDDRPMDRRGGDNG